MIEFHMVSAVYVVIKSHKPEKIEGNDYSIPFRLILGIFDSEAKANDFIAQRKKLKDRDDRGCKFSVEPWAVT